MFIVIDNTNQKTTNLRLVLSCFLLLVKKIRPGPVLLLYGKQSLYEVSSSFKRQTLGFYGGVGVVC